MSGDEFERYLLALAVIGLTCTIVSVWSVVSVLLAERKEKRTTGKDGGGTEIELT